MYKIEECDLSSSYSEHWCKCCFYGNEVILMTECTYIYNYYVIKHKLVGYE
jgi:hypothetical protein